MLFPHQLRNLLKVELHRHLDCSVRLSTLLELAPQVGIDIPLSPQQQKDLFLVTQPMKDLESVLKKFLNTQKLFTSTEILERWAYEACEDAFNDGIRLIEFRYAPSFIEEGHSVGYEKIHQAFVKGIQRAQKKWPLSVGLIATLQRIKSPQLASQIVDFVIDHKEHFVGVDLADNELAQAPAAFAEAFQRARKAGLKVTIHSGESPHPDAAKWITDSIDILGAERIGHGVQVIHSPAVMQTLKDKNIMLEVCPISNQLTQAFARWQDHPFQKLYVLGVPVSINADDPGIFATTLTDDYSVLHQVHDLQLQDFNHINQQALEASFLSESEKQKWRPWFLEESKLIEQGLFL
ncbi:MAG: adenosine deaminase [Pseudobdellovibrionaceae bacterium]